MSRFWTFRESSESSTYRPCRAFGCWPRLSGRARVVVSYMETGLMGVTRRDGSMILRSRCQVRRCGGASVRRDAYRDPKWSRYRHVSAYEPTSGSRTAESAAVGPPRPLPRRSEQRSQGVSFSRKSIATASERLSQPSQGDSSGAGVCRRRPGFDFLHRSPRVVLPSAAADRSLSRSANLEFSETHL